MTRRDYRPAMPDYRRAYEPGGTFFFTVVTERRAPLLCTETARSILRGIIAECQKARPFALEAIVLLPDHLHALWALPDGDSDYSTRWASIKARFTHEWLATGGQEQRRTGSRVRSRRRGVLQRRFWEHLIRDEEDFARHLDYIHYNPVKHGQVACPHAWPYSSLDKWVGRGVYEASWLCMCNGETVTPPKFEGLDQRAIELGSDSVEEGNNRFAEANPTR
jgi:putative transposase